MSAFDRERERDRELERELELERDRELDHRPQSPDRDHRRLRDFAELS